MIGGKIYLINKNMKQFKINILGLESVIQYCDDRSDAYLIALEVCVEKGIDPKFIQIEG